MSSRFALGLLCACVVSPVCADRDNGIGGVQNCDSRGWSEMMWASVDNRVNDVIALAPQQSRLQDDWGRTALMKAVIEGNIRVVKILAQYEQGIQDNYGYTALMWAVMSENIACVTHLLDEMGIKHDAGESALDIAMRVGNNEIITILSDADRIDRELCISLTKMLQPEDDSSDIDGDKTL